MTETDNSLKFANQQTLYSKCNPVKRLKTLKIHFKVKSSLCPI